MIIRVSDIDFYSDAVIKEPYPDYAHLRELGPVVYMEKNQLYLVARYQEVSEVLQQPLRFVSSKGVSPISRWMACPTIGILCKLINRKRPTKKLAVRCSPSQTKTLVLDV